MSKTPQQIADDALSCCNTTQDASGFIEYYYQGTPESIREEAQILLGHSKMAEQENERDAARRDYEPSWEDCYPDPWADDYAAIINGEL
jgi:hypothetical protein